MRQDYQIVRDIPPSIFRAYDVRGVVGDTLTADIVFTLGLAIASEANSRGINHLLVGCDGRLSSPKLVDALCQGILRTGCHITRIGVVPTPVLYFATHVLPIHSGVMLTGSHNPKNYNGLKIVFEKKSLTTDEVLGLQRRVLDRNFKQGTGELNSQDVVPDYIDYIVKGIHISKPLRVVIDCGNGVAGRIAPLLFERLGCEVIPLFCEVDGRFPNHHPDPSVPGNLRDVMRAVEDNNANVGFAFDGDADRLGVVTNKGEIIWPDRQLMLFSKDVLSRHPGASIVFDVKCSNYLPQLIRCCKGEPHMWKTGHSLIKSRMFDLGAILSGEMSGHIFFRERWFGFDDGLYVGARFLEIISQQAQDVSTLFHQFPDGYNTPEIKIAVDEKEKFTLVERMIERANFSDATLNTLDGLRIEFPWGWGLVRASNTTACLTLRFEADTFEALQSIKEKVRLLLSEVGIDMDESIIKYTLH